MQIILIKPEKIYRHKFLDQNSNIYWLKDIDENDNERNLILFEKKSNDWEISCGEKCAILNDDNTKINKTKITINKLYHLVINEYNQEINAYIYLQENEQYASYIVSENKEYTIGSAKDKDIVIDDEHINLFHAKLTKDEKGFLIENIENKYGVYVNNNKISSKR